MSGKQSKKFRKEVGKLQGVLASDLKSWLNERPWWKRVAIAFIIIFKGKW